jgi:putative ABC transport system substrate-binding protein
MPRTTVGLLVLLAFGLFVVPRAANAQPSKVYRIGVLSPSTATPGSDFDDLWQGLRDLGYIAGQNLAIEYRYTEGNATSTIPIIMTTVSADPVASGLVSSLARPEGNVTGVMALSADLYERRLALLKEAVPRLARLAVLVSATNP